MSDQRETIAKTLSGVHHGPDWKWEDQDDTEKGYWYEDADAILALFPDYEKYHAFWEYSRMIDRQNFEEYEWPTRQADSPDRKEVP